MNVENEIQWESFAGLPKDWVTDRETELIFESCDFPDHFLLTKVHDVWSGFRRKVWYGTFRMDDEEHERLAVVVTLPDIPEQSQWEKIRVLIDETAQIVRTTVN